MTGRGHVTDAGVRVGDDGGVLHVFGSGDRSLFTGFTPEESEVRNKQNSQINRDYWRINPYLHITHERKLMNDVRAGGGERRRTTQGFSLILVLV